jgi:putative phosphoribosyl transferase
MTALVERAVRIEQPNVGMVHGDLVLPAGAPGLVAFAHGSGSSRHSPRNRMVAEEFQRRGLGTLLMDLLTEEEEMVDERTRHLRFDIDLLADRLAGAAAGLAQDGDAAGLPIGYFGASTGAAAALVAAARHPEGVAAVVSRGGRPDLAGSWLTTVRAPTLLIVGAFDTQVIELNQVAFDQMTVERSFEVVVGASHLFEEPGTLDEVSRLAGDWFVRHLSRVVVDRSGPT